MNNSIHVCIENMTRDNYGVKLIENKYIFRTFVSDCAQQWIELINQVVQCARD